MHIFTFQNSQRRTLGKVADRTFFFGCRILVMAHGIVWDLFSMTHRLCLWSTDSVVASCQPSCPAPRGILVPWPGIKLESSALQVRFLTTGPSGQSPIERLCPWEIPNNQFNWETFGFSVGFPCGTSGKESDCQCRRHKRRKFDPWVGKWQPTLVILPGKFHGQSSLMA